MAIPKELELRARSYQSFQFSDDGGEEEVEPYPSMVNQETYRSKPSTTKVEAAPSLVMPEDAAARCYHEIVGWAEARETLRLSQLAPLAPMDAVQEGDNCSSGTSAATFGRTFGEPLGAEEMYELRREVTSTKSFRRMESGVSQATKYSRGGTSNTSAVNGKGYVDMVSFMDLPVQAFEVDEDTPKLARKSLKDAFAFKRSARRSVMLRLGLGNAHLRGSSVAETMESYVKASDRDCIKLYLAAQIGIGTFSISSSVAKAGWVPGMVALAVFAWVHFFLCQRLVELPQLLRMNMETYLDIAQACFNRPLNVAFVWMSAMTWCGICVLFLDENVRHARIIMNVSDKPQDWSAGVVLLKMACALLPMPFVFRTSAKDLRKFAYYAVWAVMIVGGLEVVLAVYNGFANWGDIKYKAIGTTGDVLEGLFRMVVSFAGIGILPYIVADMLKPDNAKKVVSFSCAWIGLFYFVVSSICYFGWGQNIADPEFAYSPIQIMFTGRMTGALAFLISGAFILKTLVTYPIFFWPLCREIESILALEGSPASELRLPWAIQHHQNCRSVIRGGLVIALMIPSLLLRDLQIVHDFVAAVPMNMVHFLFPSIFALVGILRHAHWLGRLPDTFVSFLRYVPLVDLSLVTPLTTLEEKAYRAPVHIASASYMSCRSSMSQAPAKEIQYFGGTLQFHLWATAAITGGIALFSAIFMIHFWYVALFVTKVPK